MDFKYCRREVVTVQPSGSWTVAHCGQAIARANALNWCPECRLRLPLWPTSAPVAHVGHAIAEAFGMDKLPPGLVVIHEDAVGAHDGPGRDLGQMDLLREAK